MAGKVLLLKAFWEFTELKTQAVQNKYDHRTNKQIKNFLLFNKQIHLLQNIKPNWLICL